jgi:ABC-type nitrate/sulfonate/bicarbonate transport system substrate-binding protein
VNNPGYGELVERVNVGTVDLALLSPLSYVLAERTTPGLQLLARTLTYGAPAYSSFLIVRTRDPARRLEDLKGRRVAWVDPLSTAGFLFPYGSFVERGLDPAKDLQSAVFAGHAFLGPSGADCGGVTISIGAAMHPDDAQAPYDLIGRADQALYAAKTRGRNRVVSYPDVQPA